MIPSGQSIYERAAIIPGRSSTRSKAPGRFFDVGSGGPLYCTGGDGAVLYGEAGREYIDMLCALGAVSLGYGDHEWSASGGVYSLPHLAEVEAAESVLRYVAPWASAVRFLKTGSESTHAAYRVAKRATGRSWFAMGDWAYHGWHEWCSEGSTSRIVFPHGGRFEGINGESLAAVFVEPHRWAAVDIEWLQWLRGFCDRVGALLVFDSMIYGGRFALGGTSEYYGVTPDLECFGKAFGNGQSVAFVVGNDALSEHGEVVSGTYGGDVNGANAIWSTIEEYRRRGVVDMLWERGRQLAAGLERVIPASLGVREGAPVHQRIRFADPTHGKRFSAQMAKRGVLWHPDVTNIMAAHTERQIERVIAAADESVRCL
jgi:glutamate-1-semialdehyde 2,1-aminomutase